MNSINKFIDERWDDKVFFFANRLSFKPQDGWGIYVSPENCLVSMGPFDSNIPTVDELRASALQKSSDCTGLELRGRILFSAGVLLCIDDNVLLFERDEQAPTDPLRWTSAAGRSDREPLFTALKEFHEEVILYDSNSNMPVYVDIADNPYTEEVEKIYQKTLCRKGFSSDRKSWLRLIADVYPGKIGNVYPVKTYFGDSVVDSSKGRSLPFYSFFDEPNSTLELLLPLALQKGQLDHIRLKFMDGEYNRKVRLFTEKEFCDFPESGLVSTMINVQALFNGNRA